MKIITDKERPDYIATKIYLFSVLNEAWTIREDFGAEVWLLICKKRGWRKFKCKSNKEGALVIWRIA